MLGTFVRCLKHDKTSYIIINSGSVFDIFSKATKKNNMPELTNFREFDKIFMYFLEVNESVFQHIEEARSSRKGMV